MRDINKARRLFMAFPLFAQYGRHVLNIEVIFIFDFMVSPV
jgi:hypothetical protein